MNILAIDFWTKYIWLAKKESSNPIITPIWYINNDGGTMFELANIIEQNRIWKIIIGYPTRQKNIQKKIDSFIKEFNLIYPQIKFIKQDEDFTSVEAAAQTGEFKKARWKEDTIAAMKILERYLSNQTS